MPGHPKLTLSRRHDPLSRPRAKPSFTCDVSTDEIQNETPITIHDGTVCRGCFDTGIKPQFEQAASSEFHHPVRWGAKTIEIDRTIRRFFTKAFLELWSRKTKEYATPLSERLYCVGAESTSTPDSCGVFLGIKEKHRITKTCPSCNAHTCPECEVSFTSSPQQHICLPAPEEPTDPFEGLERGRAYQKCPSCGVAVELQDGCNHIACVGNCNTHFCFLCGEPATREDGHWQSGKPCPLYNRAGDANAQYDHGAQAMADLQALTRSIVDEVNAELAGVESQDIDPAELKLRRRDREFLFALSQKIKGRKSLAQHEGQEPLAGDDKVLALLPSMSVLVSYYTLALEQDEPLRERRQSFLNATLPLLEQSLQDLGAEAYDRYPGLQMIITSIMKAMNGEGFATHAAEKLANEYF